MGRMIRKQVYIEERHEEILKRLSHELHVSESDLIREGIDTVDRLREADAGDRDDWRATLRFVRNRATRGDAAFEQMVDDEAWDEEMAFIRERGKLKVPQEPRRWRREDLYDERPRYLAR